MRLRMKKPAPQQKSTPIIKRNLSKSTGVRGVSGYGVRRGSGHRGEERLRTQERGEAQGTGVRGGSGHRGEAGLRAQGEAGFVAHSGCPGMA